MLLFPAIDLKDGQCVRLFKGRFDQKTVYGQDPPAMAERWVNEGALWLHLIDLDGSLGDNQANRKALMEIRRRVGARLQLGGGIRTMAQIEAWFDLGVDRLILGTVACQDPELVTRATSRYPGRLAVALDAVGEEVMVKGWTCGSGKNLFNMAAGLKEMGLAMIIYTDIDRDGAQEGLNLARTRLVAATSGLPTVAAGGISTIADLKALLPLADDGVVGAISGRALYEGQLDFAEGQKLLKSAGCPDFKAVCN